MSKQNEGGDQPPKKKFDLVNLQKLADASKSLETKGGETPISPATPVVNEDETRSDTPAVEPAAPVQQTSSVFKSFMSQDPKYKGNKRTPIPFYDTVHAKLAAVAAAENTDIIILANNIVDRWFKKYKDDCEKSLENARVKF